MQIWFLITDYLWRKKWNPGLIRYAVEKVADEEVHPAVIGFNFFQLTSKADLHWKCGGKKLQLQWSHIPACTLWMCQLHPDPLSSNRIGSAWLGEGIRDWMFILTIWHQCAQAEDHVFVLIHFTGFCFKGKATADGCGMYYSCFCHIVFHLSCNNSLLKKVLNYGFYVWSVQKKRKCDAW